MLVGIRDLQANKNQINQKRDLKKKVAQFLNHICVSL